MFFDSKSVLFIIKCFTYGVFSSELYRWNQCSICLTTESAREAIYCMKNLKNDAFFGVYSFWERPVILACIRFCIDILGI